MARSLILVFLYAMQVQFGLSQQSYLLVPDRVFDGSEMIEGVAVLVEGNEISKVGDPENMNLPSSVERISLPGTTLMPGMIEGHAHILLHPYDETNWNDQVLKESEVYRSLRAVLYAEETLKAGFTTIRDLGSEGANYADVSIKKAIEDGLIAGPRMIVSGKAIVATGSYGPKGFRPDMEVPLGAEEADGYDNIIKVVRDQIGNGADFIKVYADYRWGPMGQAMPTFTIEEMKLMVEIAGSSGRVVVAHAATEEGMRRATMAGVKTIEHGDGGTPEVFQLMKKNGVALCPTLAAGDAIMQYRGWKKGSEPDPERIKRKKESFKAALDSGVTICAGGDVGVFSHGDNARELIMMHEYGMEPLDILRSVTSVNANWFGLEKLGEIKAEFLADLVAVEGSPLEEISVLQQIRLVMKNGEIVE